MTIALGINFGDYILLAADTRTTFGWPNYKIGYTDETEKIQKTSCGLITGAGRTVLLDSVKIRLAKQEITNSDQIFEIIKEQRLSLLREAAITANDIAMTGWIFSYMTILNDATKLRLDVVHPSLAEGSVRWEENKAAVICPVEATKQEANAIIETLNDAIKPFPEFTTVEQSYQYHAQVIAALIRKIQPSYPSISRYIQIGIHKLDGSIEISSVTPIDKPE